MTQENPISPSEPNGSVNHQEKVAPQSDTDRVLGDDETRDDGAVPANPGPVPAEPEDMSDTGSDIGHLAPDPAAEEVAE